MSPTVILRLESPTEEGPYATGESHCFGGDSYDSIQRPGPWSDEGITEWWAAQTKDEELRSMRFGFQSWAHLSAWFPRHDMPRDRKPGEPATCRVVEVLALRVLHGTAQVAFDNRTVISRREA